MKVLFSPQVSGSVINYQFENEVVTVSIGNETDIFDFTNLPNGEATNIKTTLPINPIISAERKEGVLELKVLNFITDDATEDERFPTWQVIE